jgi:hypothetical protein
MESKALAMADVHPGNNQSITEQQQKRQSEGLLNVSAAKEKTNAIIDGLTLLATAYNEPLTADRIEVYTMALLELSTEELQHGFNRALRETKWWPKPSELLEFCTGRASAMADKLTIDNAWTWVCLYLDSFGVAGSPRWQVQGRKFNGLSIEAFVRDNTTGGPFAVSAPFYEVARFQPPEISEIVRRTLVAMSGSVKVGLTRISDAKRGWNSADGCALNTKDSSFVRKDFDEHCSRVLAAVHADRPKTINPALQLPGAARSLFPSPTMTLMAYRIKGTLSGYEACRLTLEEAEALHDEGKLSEALYAETVEHYRYLKREEEWRNIPQELNAVFLGIYDRNRLLGSDWDSWLPLGTFNIEDAEGTRVFREYLPMAIGTLSLAIGDSIRFTGRLSELRFSEQPRYVFDLNKAITNNKEK